jgi:hypothetical protein
MTISSVSFQRSLLGAARRAAPVRAKRLSRRQSKNLIVVQGSQRSGTTLLYLMLRAHPGVVGLDENEADYELPPWLVMGVNGVLGKRTLYKLPPVIWQVDKLQDLYPHCFTLWVYRHPYAVVSSMKNLYFEKERQSWLQRFGARELGKARSFFPDLGRLDIGALSEAEIAAHLWVAKQRMIEVYRMAGLAVQAIRYEALVSDAESVARSVVRELGLEWTREVLEHHRNRGRELHPGGTRADRPIDPSRARPKLNLTDEEKRSIIEICRETMTGLGYGAE